MNKTLKAIGKFFTNKKVHLWAVIMACVIVVAFGIMSWIMVADKVMYSKVTYKNTVRTNGTDTVVSKTKIDFVPELRMVDTITIANGQEELSSESVQLNNNMICGTLDPVVPKSEAKIVSTIMQRLDKGRKTDSFSQFFTGGSSGDQRIVNTWTSSWEFQEASNDVWIKIVFATPEFVINRIDNKPWEIQKYDPAYTRPIDAATGNPYGTSVSQYNRYVVNAIHIPLGNAKNKFTRQTWYLSVGTEKISNTTSMGFTFTTYGNYYSLLRYVRGITDETLL